MQSTDTTVAGSYKIKLNAALQNYPTITATTTFTANLINL